MVFGNGVGHAVSGVSVPVMRSVPTATAVLLLPPTRTSIVPGRSTHCDRGSPDTAPLTTDVNPQCENSWHVPDGNTVKASHCSSAPHPLQHAATPSAPAPPTCIVLNGTPDNAVSSVCGTVLQRGSVKIASERGVIVSGTVVAAPAAMCTRAKSTSDSDGVTEAGVVAVHRMYACTTSSAATTPLFWTETTMPTSAQLPASMVSCCKVVALTSYAKLLYDMPATRSSDAVSVGVHVSIQ